MARAGHHHQHGVEGTGRLEGLQRRRQLLSDETSAPQGPGGNGAAVAGDFDAMATLLELFIPEAREYLESAAQGLLKLERTPSSESLINEVFRAVHTL